MKQYDRFGEYMFDLLFAPLKRGKRAVNQFFIFFKVIGRVFDGLKEDALRVRDEANVASASAVMLRVHGQDRDMPRLEGEDVETYRTRLSMKGIISEWSGTRQGILYVLSSLGYQHSSIEPAYQQDPKRWAEFTVHLGVGDENAVRSFYAIFSEIQRVKEGSSRLACIVFTMKPICTAICVGGGFGSDVLIRPLIEPDRYDFRSVVHSGGALASRAFMAVRENTSPPPSTTIRRTGGVCTIISNLSKGG